MVKAFIICSFVLASGVQALACTQAEVSKSAKAYASAKDHFGVGEVTKLEVSLAKTSLYMNQACLAVDSGEITCIDLVRREAKSLEKTIDSFNVGETTLVEVNGAALRSGIAGELCF